LLCCQAVRNPQTRNPDPHDRGTERRFRSARRCPSTSTDAASVSISSRSNRPSPMTPSRNAPSARVICARSLAQLGSPSKVPGSTRPTVEAAHRSLGHPLQQLVRVADRHQAREAIHRAVRHRAVHHRVIRHRVETLVQGPRVPPRIQDPAQALPVRALRVQVHLILDRVRVRVLRAVPLRTELGDSSPTQRVGHHRTRPVRCGHHGKAQASFPD